MFSVIVVVVVVVVLYQFCTLDVSGNGHGILYEFSDAVFMGLCAGESNLAPLHVLLINI